MGTGASRTRGGGEQISVLGERDEDEEWQEHKLTVTQVFKNSTTTSGLVVEAETQLNNEHRKSGTVMT